MSIANIVIAACLISGLNIGCFVLGVIYERKREKTEHTMNEATIKAIKESAEWIDF